ncbi:hypothetical protein D3C72_1905230 [compost metagenome]
MATLVKVNDGLLSTGGSVGVSLLLPLPEISVTVLLAGVFAVTEAVLLTFPASLSL